MHPFSRRTLANTGSGAWLVRGSALGAHDGPTWVDHQGAHAPLSMARGVDGMFGKVNIGAVYTGISRELRV